MDPLPFNAFSGQHGIAVLLSLAGAVGLVWAVRRRGSERLNRAAKWGLALGCLASEAFLLIFWVRMRGWDWEMLLPLHLCDLALLLAPAALLTGNGLLYELLYFWGIGGAVQALLQPIIFTGFPAPQCVCFFLAHGLLVGSALFATLVMGKRPTGLSLLRAWLITNVYAAIIFPINYALDTNYLFIMGAPPTPSILDLMGQWPLPYLVVLDATALVVCALCYAPFFVRDRCRGG
jgi:hypothetical integral membrane protein (TIGR02206 family)